METEVESGLDKMLVKNATKNFDLLWVITRILVPFLAIAFLDAASPPQEVPSPRAGNDPCHFEFFVTLQPFSVIGPPGGGESRLPLSRRS